MAAAQAEFARFDRTLNEVYARARADLSEWDFEKVREEQREWIEYRDQRAEAAARFDGGAEEGKERENVEYWNALGWLTETRIEILRGWIRADDFSKTWEGAWIDGYGGELLVAEGAKGDLLFTLEVVRGPTYHLGNIGGIAKANVRTARFSTKDEVVEEETWLTFLLQGRRLEVIGENTMPFHGARAYFDGKYVRVRELTAEDRKRIEEAP